MDGALIGKSYARISVDQLPALLVQRVTRARAKHEIANSDFMYQTIQRDFLQYIKMNKTETAVPHLSLHDIRNFVIMVPSVEEQTIIGKFFTNLDNLITLHQRKFEGRLTFAFGTVSCIYKPVSSCSGFSGMISHMPCAVRHAVTARQAASIRSSGLHPNSFAMSHIPERDFRGRYFCRIFFLSQNPVYSFFWSIRQNLLIWQMQAPGGSQVSCSCTEDGCLRIRPVPSFSG